MSYYTGVVKPELGNSEDSYDYANDRGKSFAQIYHNQYPVRRKTNSPKEYFDDDPDEDSSLQEEFSQYPESALKLPEHFPPDEKRPRRYVDLLFVNATLLHRMNTGLWYLAVYNDAIAQTQVTTVVCNFTLKHDGNLIFLYTLLT